MKPGRELDAIVAERVMGYEVRDETWRQPPSSSWREVPHYSSDIAAAWEVVERMRADGWKLYLTVPKVHPPGIIEPTVAYFQRDDEPPRSPNWRYETHVPSTICLAALRALNIEF